MILDTVRERISGVDIHGGGSVSQLVQAVDQQCLVILGELNLFQVYAKGTLVHSYPCTSGKNGFGEEYGSGKTPRGLHITTEVTLGNKNQSFYLRKPENAIIPPTSKPQIVPSITTGVISITGKELRNRNTDLRDIFIHGTANEWVLDERDRKKRRISSGCIGLKPDDIRTVCSRIQAKVPVYIFGDSDPIFRT